MSQTGLFEPFANRMEQVVLSPELIRGHRLDVWAEHFQLGTAGYRDLENVNDLFDLDVPFNPVTMAILTEASCRLYRSGDVIHLGGEVRPWTQEYINLAARIYAAHGIVCRLRGERDVDGPIRTTPIWMSSFGCFHEELAGGENFTASHSQSYKGGRKPMDGRGMQLLDGAAVIEAGVRDIVRQALAGGYVIRLAPTDSDRIREDFDVTAAYADYLQSVIPEELLNETRQAGRAGFRAAISTEGGSMGRTARKIFELLDLPTGPGGLVDFRHFEERPDYYGIGIVDGVNHGVDPGKWQIYKNIGARELLLGGEADVFFIWDPDGDRFNMVTRAPAVQAKKAIVNGLEVEEAGDNAIVYFKPNQIYFMLLAFRLEFLQQAGLLRKFHWLLMETYPTSRSLVELATRFEIPTFHTPVGFKHFGNATAHLEEQLLVGAGELTLTDVREAAHRFPRDTRVLLMAEESGGAAMGGVEPLRSRMGARQMLALKEKDAFQVGVLALALAARLHRERISFAEYYVDRLDRYGIRYRHYERRDVTLFDESLTGGARERAMADGHRRKDAAVAFFRGLADRFTAGTLNAGQVTAGLQARAGSQFVFPPVQDIFWAGDGTFVQFDGLWFQLRSSGTDAVLRYYAEGRMREEVRQLNAAMANLDLAD
jgi:phosphomannomutase